MTQYERRQSIIELLREQPGFEVAEMASTLGVSEGTVRNDLNALEHEGMLRRYHGGAVLIGHRSFQNKSFADRYHEHSVEKEIIGHHAAKLVSDGDSILLDASSMIYYFALALEVR
jgi:DeoR/GlpR family transcriptional regulator of sugar metabolism